MKNIHSIKLLIVLAASALLFGCTAEVSESVNVAGIEVSSVPSKINYTKGDALNLSGLVVKMNMTDGSAKELSSSDYTVSPANGSTLNNVGSVPIKITASEKTTFFPVYVESPAAVYTAGIEVSSLPVKKDYKKGELLDLSGLVVKQNMTDGTSAVFSDYTVEPEEGTELTEEGSFPVKITADGKTTFFTVYVGKRELKKLSVTSLPDTIYYLSGETFNSDGLSVTVEFDDGTTQSLEYGEYRLSLADGSSLLHDTKLKDGIAQKVTVSYASLSTFFVINVSYSFDTVVIADVDDTKKVERDGSGNVTTICAYAYENAKNLKTVTLPDTLEEIGMLAFYGCEALEEIDLKNVKEIDRYAFYGCKNLKTLVIPDNCYIGEEAFSGCDSITTLTFKGRWSCGKRAFANMTSLTTLDLGKKIDEWGRMSAGDGAFYNCTSLCQDSSLEKKLTIPNGFRAEWQFV